MPDAMSRHFIFQYLIQKKYIESSGIPYARPILCSTSPMLDQQNVTVTFLLLKLRIVSDVFVSTLTQHCRVGLISDWCQSSACVYPFSIYRYLPFKFYFLKHVNINMSHATAKATNMKCICFH